MKTHFSIFFVSIFLTLFALPVATEAAVDGVRVDSESHAAARRTTELAEAAELTAVCEEMQTAALTAVREATNAAESAELASVCDSMQLEALTAVHAATEAARPVKAADSIELAKTDAVRLWDLDDCQQFAIENSPRTRIQSFVNRQRNQDVIAAVGAMTPSLSAESGLGWSFGRGIDPSTDTYDDLSNFNNSYSIGAQMVIFAGLRNINTLRASRLARLRGVQEFQKARDDVSLATLQAYVKVVYCIESQRLAEQQLEESRRNLHSTRRQAELGLKSMPDVAQFEAEVAGFEFTLTKQQNALETSLLELKNTMNFPLDEPLAIDPRVATLTPSDENDAKAIFHNVHDNLPAMQIADYVLDESRLQLAVTRGAYYPSVSAYGNLGSNYFKNLTSDAATTDFRDQIRNNYGSSVGLRVSIPILNGAWQRTRVNRAKNEYRIAQETHNETIRQIETEIRQAVMDVEGGGREWVQAVRKLDATRTAHRANQRRFDEGLISALELQNSTNQLLTSQIEELDARLQYGVKCWLLDFYRNYEN